MQISANKVAHTAARVAQPKTEKPSRESTPVDSFSSGVSGFYKEYRSAIHIGGGALLGAGIAAVGGGLTGSAVMSAAGSGALGGFLVSSPREALTTAGGAVLGATIATLAGMPGAAVVSAAGTGALIGFVIG